MGKIYDLFGRLDKQDVAMLPNDVLKKSIASGNYGHEKILPNVGSVDMNNPIVKYLLNADNEKNIVYWHQKIEKGMFSWVEMLEYFTNIGLRKKGGFHPYSYGVGRFSCEGLHLCNKCHKDALKLLYQLYKDKP